MLKTLIMLELKRLMRGSNAFALFLSFGLMNLVLLGLFLKPLHLSPALLHMLFYMGCILSLFLIDPASLKGDHATGFLDQIYLERGHFWPYLLSHLLAGAFFFTGLCLVLLGFAALFLHFSWQDIQMLTLLIILTVPSLIALLYLGGALTLSTTKTVPLPLLLSPFLVPLMIAAFTFLHNLHQDLSLQTPLLLCAAFFIFSFTVIPHVCHFLLKEALDS